MYDILTIIIPVFNEETALKTLLPETILFCKSNFFKLIIINDNSSDNTKEIINTHNSDNFIKIINHKINKGYGGSIKSGITMADTKYIVTIDGDGQHNLSDVTTLLNEIIKTDADMIVGSRKNNKIQNFYRNTGKYIIRSFAKILLNFKIYDINSGLKIYNTELAKKYIAICPDSMAYSDIITLTFINQKHLVIERPITINQRVAGTSKISTMTAIETIKEILNIVVLFNPMRLFFPLSCLCILSGLVWGIPLIILGRGVSGASLLAIITGLIFFFLGLIAEQLSLIIKNNIK